MTLSARELNFLLPYRRQRAYSKSTWRRAVRAVQAERAKFLEWEGKREVARAVRPLRRSRGPLVGSYDYAEAQAH